MDELEEIKAKLLSYQGAITFNEPHFTAQLELRCGSRSEVIHHLTDPSSLAFFQTEKGKFGDTKHILYFRISSNRTMILPAILGTKSLYILTYILRHRKIFKARRYFI